MVQERGKVTLGVTSEGALNLATLMDMEDKWFDSEMTAYRLAITTALSHDLAVQQGPLKDVTTKYNIGSLDPDGRLREMIRLLGPADARDPYDIAEKLADAGLDLLNRQLVGKGLMLSEVISTDPPGQDAQREIEPGSEAPPL